MRNWLKSILRRLLWPKLTLRPNLPNRKALGVTEDSAREWFNSREYKYLLSLLSDELDAATVDFLNVAANDPAAVGRRQATIKYLRWMIEDMKDQVMEEVKEAENA